MRHSVRHVFCVCCWIFFFFFIFIFSFSFPLSSFFLLHSACLCFHAILNVWLLFLGKRFSFSFSFSFSLWKIVWFAWRLLLCFGLVSNERNRSKENRKVNYSTWNNVNYTHNIYGDFKYVRIGCRSTSGELVFGERYWDCVGYWKCFVAHAAT